MLPYLQLTQALCRKVKFRFRQFVKRYIAVFVLRKSYHDTIKDSVVPFFLSFKDEPAYRSKSEDGTANSFFSLAVLGIKGIAFQGFL